MKITKSQLKQIIKEELDATLKEGDVLNPNVQGDLEKAEGLLKAGKPKEAIMNLISAIHNLNMATHARQALTKPEKADQ
jgi:hypothetical protein